MDTTGVRSFPVYWDDTYTALSAFNVTGTPAALLVDGNGNPLAGWSGPFSLEEVLNYL